MTDPHGSMTPNNHYHVYTRAVGDEKLFRSDENYRYFLRRLKKYILPVAKVWTYSILPNHFHLLIKIKEEEMLEAYYKIKKRKEYDPQKQLLSDFVMEQFSNCLNGYTKAFNKMYNRKGALFMDYLRRTKAADDHDISSFIFYIHKNAVHHQLASEIGNWKYDGYNAIISEKETTLARQEVIEWFGSIDLFKKFHDQPIELKKGFTALE